MPCPEYINCDAIRRKQGPFFLLPLWEKVARTQSAPDEGSLSAETDPSPVRDASASRPPKSELRSSRLPQGEKESKNLMRRSRETVRLELVAQRGLEDLAGRGVWNALDEGDVVRHPPFGDLAIHEFQDVLARGGLAGLELDDQQRTLVPFGMMDADHGGFRDRGMSDREIFQVDRRDPFAAGFDHVLGAIGDPHIAVLI